MTERITRVDRPSYQELLESLRDTPQIKALQGVRRCGKSTILSAFRDRLVAEGVPERNIIFKRLDEFGLPLVTSAEELVCELEEAFDRADSHAPSYVLLDEIQEVEGWERVVRSLHTRPATDVYVTGSNAHMLSSDLATLLSGRYVSVPVHPLSFSEYLSFLEAYGEPSAEDAAFADYLRFGGMPGLFALRELTQEGTARELSAIMDTVVLNDVARRLNLRDVALLQRLIAYLFSTSGNLLSTNKVVGALTGMGRRTSSETIDNYINALEQAFIVREASQTGLQGKTVLAPLRKFYPVDLGLRNLATRFRAGDTGFQLENLVFNELIRRGYHIEVGALRTGEVDFVATRADERLYVQVTETMLGEKTRERELTPLLAIRDAFPKMVLTLDRLGLGVTEEGIRVANTVDWVLGRE